MAFKKSLQLNNGFTAEYWRLTKVPADKLHSQGEVVVTGYKDKATRDNGGAPIARKVFTINTSALDYSEDLFEQAYVIIKDMKERKDLLNQNATAFFADAQNV